MATSMSTTPLAFYALLALCCLAAAAGVAGRGPYPCGEFLNIDFQGDDLCERQRCGRLCVRKLMGKYPHVKAIIGDCTADNPRTCICEPLCSGY